MRRQLKRSVKRVLELISRCEEMQTTKESPSSVPLTHSPHPGKTFRAWSRVDYWAPGPLTEIRVQRPCDHTPSISTTKSSRVMLRADLPSPAAQRRSDTVVGAHFGRAGQGPEMDP